MPSTLQERWFARLYLALPTTIGVLALVWVLTGVIALVNLDAAARLTPFPDSLARIAVVSGAIVDVSLGMAILYRPWSRAACWGMAIVTGFYLALGTLLRPDLWTDPLGPLLKAIPILFFALFAAVLVDDR